MNQGMRGRGVIRTPDQRLRVFVSSTVGEQGELAAERRAVVRAISALRLTPVLFEEGARPYPPRDLYRAYLAQSDIFVGLYWQRYGRVGPGMEVSSLEEELQLSEGLPRLLYVKTPAPGREPRLAGLLERVKQEASDSYRYFRTPAELGRLVGDDLAALLSERFAAGSRAVAPGSVPPSRSPMAGLPTGTVTFLFTDMRAPPGSCSVWVTAMRRSKTPMRRSYVKPSTRAAVSRSVPKAILCSWPSPARRGRSRPR